ncbi:NUMOD1 domain-containing DNA-binding protein [Flagellimonas sp. SN16]|uniref:NUMOD1 domain-containing DNA-binding protein n=1 Tax=Flagellimonas sp. SN16 TaxID=3415142 RepID=UPI003C505FA9
MIFIYLLKYPDGKVYVGQTSNPQDRFRQHKNCSKNHPEYLTSLIEKFGWDNIEKEIVCSVALNEIASVVENAVINHYSPNSVNISGFDHPFQRTTPHPLSEEVVQLTKNGKYLNTFKSSSAAAESVNGTQGNISSVINGYKNSAYGFLWVKKLDYDLGYVPKYTSRSETQKKEVVQLDLDGNEIKWFPSIKEASETTGIDRSVIIRALKGKVKPRKYNWKYGNI